MPFVPSSVLAPSRKASSVLATIQFLDVPMPSLSTAGNVTLAASEINFSGRGRTEEHLLQSPTSSTMLLVASCYY